MVMPLSLEARGALITLLCYQWEQGVIPADPAQTGRICGAQGPAWARCWEEIRHHFAPADGGLAHEPTAEARLTQLGRVRANRENGRKGGRRPSQGRTEVDHLDIHPVNQSVRAGLADLNPPGRPYKNKSKKIDDDDERGWSRECLKILQALPAVARCRGVPEDAMAEALAEVLRELGVPLDRWGEAAGAARDWCMGRGIYSESSIDNRTAACAIRDAWPTVRRHLGLSNSPGKGSSNLAGLTRPAETSEAAVERRIAEAAARAGGGGR